jgi:hypothetical protein
MPLSIDEKSNQDIEAAALKVKGESLFARIFSMSKDRF